MKTIFFYGLFMDRSLLTAKGLHPHVVGPAVLPGYRLHIGERATLVPSAGNRAYGIVMVLAPEESAELYSDRSVRAYAGEQVQVEMLDTGETRPADCYNLPHDSDLAGTNPAYASKLARLAEELQFDAAYVQEIAGLGEG